MLNWIVWNRTDYSYLALNNIQRLICYTYHPTTHPINQPSEKWSMNDTLILFKIWDVFKKYWNLKLYLTNKKRKTYKTFSSKCDSINRFQWGRTSKIFDMTWSCILTFLVLSFTSSNFHIAGNFFSGYKKKSHKTVLWVWLELYFTNNCSSKSIKTVN